MRSSEILLPILLILLWPVSLFAQIPPGYYEGTEGLYGDQLKAKLHTIIDDHDEPSYNDLRDYILPESDEDPQNPNNVILLYTGRSQAKSTFGGGVNEWNREHVWAKSHGDFGNTPPCGTDAHMIRPTDVSVNAARGNKDFDEGGQQHSEATECYYTTYTWEPRDAVKGDVARMILYMDVRYEGTSGELDLTVVDAVNTSPAPEHGRLSTLLEWHEQDPPDAFEINRNEVVYSYQGNRNPFIDHPEFVANIWAPAASVEDMARLDAGFYPNPVSDCLHVSLQAESDHCTLSIINMVGVELISNIVEGKGSLKINCDDLPSGLYVLRISDEQNRKYYVSTFIKH
ncbi:MAG: endonuclease [Bacteroidales bacterium]|jgi:endonuclease I|nr:endonuclease [Bacteroidales bacterium]